MSHVKPNILLLKEKTDVSQGRGQLLSNIQACDLITRVVRTTLGPRGTDKLMVSHKGNVVISNDGATILTELDISHPATKVLAEISLSQDNEVGDGTTSVCVLAGELLQEAKYLIEAGLPVQVIIKGFRQACAKAIEHLETIAIKTEAGDPEIIRRVAGTALCSKLISSQKDLFADIVQRAVTRISDDIDLKNIGVKLIPGGSVTQSELVNGVAIEKTFSYAGFEQQCKTFTNAKVLVLNLELELKAERENSEIRVTNAKDFQSMVDAEWDVIYEKLAAVVDSGANIVLSRLPIGDLATQYFADRDMFCAGRVPQDELERVARATGARVQTTVYNLKDNLDSLGMCGKFTEKQVGAQRYNFFEDCNNPKAATIILRGGSRQYLEEAERSLHDALMVAWRASKSLAVVGGGGAVEYRLHKYLQGVIESFAKALLVIPRTLAENAGIDVTSVCAQLKSAHANGDCWMGVDCIGRTIMDTNDSHIIEPIQVKRTSITTATEAACLILSIDQTIKNPKAQNPVEENRRVPIPGQ